MNFRMILPWKQTLNPDQREQSDLDPQCLQSRLPNMRGSRKVCQVVQGGHLFFLVDDGREDPNTTKCDPHWPASETTLKCCFAGWLMMAQH